MTENDRKLLKEFKVKMFDRQKEIERSDDMRWDHMAYGWFRAKGCGDKKAIQLADKACLGAIE